ncbi:unnamed protein product [Owenia fusiformis]|uniref:Uncharacterized protein n=1 Tax=Owenia fusiformis TaxID=6347 RepID=A0A8J1TV42_OWEFU|nr:unnamed protein product [Owenia fusiformis]
MKKFWKKNDSQDDEKKENNVEEDKPIKTYDDFLTQKVGVKLYQFLHLTEFYILLTFGGYQTTFTNFIAASMDHWCNIPELTQRGFNQSLLKHIGIPTENQNSTSYQKCKMYSINYTAYSNDDLLSGQHLVDFRNSNSSLVNCRSGMSYDQSHYISTLMSQYELVCEREVLSTFAASSVMLGFFFGAFVSGQLADRLGRVRTAAVFHLLALATAFGSIWSPNYPLYLVLRAICGMSYLAAYTAYFTSCLEVLDPKTRGMLPLFMAFTQSIASWILPLMAYNLRNHIDLQIVCACLMIPSVIINLLMPESSRWQLASGNVDGAYKTLKKIAWVNGRALSDDCLSILENISKEEIKSKEEKQSSQKATVLDLFKTPRMRKNTLIVFGVWFAAVFGNYVIRLNIGTLIPGSIYLNFFAVFQIAAVAQLPMRYVAFYKVGRRVAFMVLLITSAGFAFLIIGLLATRIQALVAGASIVGYCFAACAFGVVYQYSAEIFPTVARGAGVGGGSSFGRIGGFIAPQVPLLGRVWYGLPYLIMGMIPLLSGISTFFLPETFNKNLPETLEEGELFGTKEYEERFGKAKELKDQDVESKLSNGEAGTEMNNVSNGDLPTKLDSNFTVRDPYYTDVQKY